MGYYSVKEKAKIIFGVSMSLWVLLIALIILFVVLINTTKDFLSPGVIFCIPWIFSTAGLLLSKFSFDKNSACFYFLLIGAILFEIGYLIGHKVIVYNQRFSESNITIECIGHRFKLFIVIEIILYIFITISILNFIRKNFNVNFLLSYYSNREDYQLGTFVGTVRDLLTGAGISIIIASTYFSEETKKKYKYYINLQYIVYITMTILRMTRNGILFGLMPLFICLLFTHKERNKDIIKLAIIAAITFIAYFVFYSTLKYYSSYTKGSFIDNANRQVSIYLASPLIAFQYFFKNKIVYLNGANTFRFILDVIDKIFGTKFDPGIIQKYIYIDNITTTNVYTVYQYYAQDFGLWYALVMEFLLGIFHGRTYKKASSLRPYHVAIYAFSIYPLFMQFFQDQYFSLFGAWVKVFIGVFLTLRTNMMFSYKYKNI